MRGECCDNFWAGQSALVTGGGGFLGSAIIRQLVEAGCGQVASFGRSPRPELLALGVEALQGDLRDTVQVAAAAKGRSVVFHCAAKAGVWGRWEDYHAINVLGTRAVLDACRRHGVGLLVHTSSPSAACDDGDQEGVDESRPYPERFLAPYPRSKAEAEREVLTANGASLATVAIRPPLLWGPGDPHLLPRVIAKAKAGRLPRIGDGTNKVDLTYIDNAAAAHLLAARRLAMSEAPRGKAYFISDGAPVKLWEWINEFLGRLGIAPVRRRIPYRAAYVAGALCEAVYRLGCLPGEPPMTRFAAKSLAKSRWFDISAAARDLGYVPAFDPAEAMRRTVEHFRRTQP